MGPQHQCEYSALAQEKGKGDYDCDWDFNGNCNYCLSLNCRMELVIASVDGCVGLYFALAIFFFNFFQFFLIELGAKNTPTGVSTFAPLEPVINRRSGLGLGLRTRVPTLADGEWV